MGVLIGDSSSATPAQAETELSEVSGTSASSTKTQVRNGLSMEAVDGIGGEDVETKPMHSGRGYNWFIAAVIIVADMVGGGLVAMPAGFHDTGAFLLIVLLSNSSGSKTCALPFYYWYLE
ncbi:unnamed protein product [Gongylonema pulchrum]|uniref:Aa_trans domain-containing protein n=1 Tax=Gongylonema pulchrum TaxID=637853 RepID=A0A183CUJ1_9BILA|nr:unnamed protein product [Gongylonema pulchrum]